MKWPQDWSPTAPVREAPANDPPFRVSHLVFFLLLVVAFGLMVRAVARVQQDAQRDPHPLGGGGYHAHHRISAAPSDSAMEAFWLQQDARMDSLKVAAKDSTR